MIFSKVFFFVQEMFNDKLKETTDRIGQKVFRNVKNIDVLT